MNQVLGVDSVRGTASLQGGIVLHDAIAALDARGLHFPSLGSFSDQSISGVIATSTHGSTLHHGTFSDLVVGVEAVLSDGSVINLTGDDPRLKAFRTSLGQLGIVTRVDIACTLAFYLSCAIRPVAEDEGFATIVETARVHEYVSMLWLPYVKEASIRILSRFDATGRNEIAARPSRRPCTATGSPTRGGRRRVSGGAGVSPVSSLARPLVFGPDPPGLLRRRRCGGQVVQRLPLRQVPGTDHEPLPTDDLQ